MTEREVVSIRDYFEKLHVLDREHLTQRFIDFSLQQQQRFDAQQKAVQDALASAEKAVNAALSASEKAVNKAEEAQALRNEAQNEFRKSLSDLSGLMWTIKEGSATVDGLRRELSLKVEGIENKLSSDIENLRISRDTVKGRSEGLSAGWGWIVGSAGLIAAMVGVAAAFLNEG